jgi:hypothetical protein
MILVLKSSAQIKHQDKGALRRLFRNVRRFFRTDEEFREFLRQIDMDNTTPMNDIDNSPQIKLTVRECGFDDAHDVMSKPKTKTGTPQTKPKKQIKEPV